MKRKMIMSLFVLIFIFIFGFKNVKVDAAEEHIDYSMNQSYIINLKNSLNIYSQIMPSLETGIGNFNGREYIIYDEDFAGAYVDDNGYLNICMVNNLESDIQYLGSSSGIIYREHAHSYNFLQEIMNALENIMSTTTIYSVSIDEELNSVLIELKDENDIQQIIGYLQAENLYESSAITFEVEPEGEIVETSTTAYGGESIVYKYKDNNVSRGTLTINAVDNVTGSLGVLTNAHVVINGRTMYYGEHYDVDTKSYSNEENMEYIGTATKYCYGDIDAAYVPFENQGEWEITPYGKYDNTIYDNVWLGNDKQIISGQKIIRIGQTTGITSGKIKSKNAMIIQNGEIITKLITYSNPPEPGDSGGPIYVSDGEKLYLIGINFAKGEKWYNKNKGYACRITKVMSALNVTPITNDCFNTTLLNDGTIQLDGINFDVSGEFNIPSSLEGRIVTKIGPDAFSNNKQITKIGIPDSVSEISNSAFENCTSLTTVNLYNKQNVINLGPNAFNGCISLNEIKVPIKMRQMYCDDSNWKKYKDFIGCIEERSLYNFHCRTTKIQENITLKGSESFIYKLKIDCPIQYAIEGESENNIGIKIYNSDYSLLENGTTIKLSSNKYLAYDYPLLEVGEYYVHIFLNSENEEGSINYSIEPHTSTDDYISMDSEVNVLEHLHDNKNEFIISPSKSGVFLLELLAKVDDEYIEVDADFVIKNSNGEIIQKMILSEYNHPAESINKSNNIMFYANQWGGYTVYLDVEDLDYQELTLKVSEIEDFTIYNLNEEDQYVGNNNIPIGDSAYIYNIERIGTYDISFEYQGTQWKNMLFVLFETDEQGEYIYKDSFEINKNNNYFQYDDCIEYSKNLLLCVFDSNGNGTLTVEISKNLSDEFTIYGASSPTASAISLTKGHQEICYLGPDAPNPTSRYDYYNWYSTNENVILVSAYGTVTAVGVGEAQVKCVYKADSSITATLSFEVIDDPLDNGDNANDIYLNYGFDVRIGGTTSGTEVTGDKGSVIHVSDNPYVSIHISYTRLICLGSDSPNSSVQAFNWTVYRENDDKGMVNVSQFGTITGITSGWVTVEGTYKYNSRYKVKFKIYVENNI